MKSWTLILFRIALVDARHWGVTRTPRASISIQISNRGLDGLENAFDPLSSVERFRGGSLDSLESEDYDEEDFSDDEDDADALFDDAEVEESDFAEANVFDRIVEEWKTTPPVTKAYFQASFAATVFGVLTNNNEFPKFLTLEWKPALRGFQLWRLFTSFLNIGPFGMGYLLTAHFVWSYMSTLERMNHNRPFDFWIMLVFGQLCMVIGYPILKMSPRFLGHNLSTFMVYVWGRYHEGTDVNLLGLFNAKAELLPWFFLGQTYLLEGEPPVMDFLGIVFGHIYHHFSKLGILSAPEALVSWYRGKSAIAQSIRKLYKPISADFEAEVED